jgi:hypothetical protein
MNKKNPHGGGGGGFFACLCRPRHVEDTGVLSSNSTMLSTMNKRRGGGDQQRTFMDELAAASFNPADHLGFFPNDDTEPTIEEEAEEEVVEEDPFEKAYRFWYAKGILSFVPQSIQDGVKNDVVTDENMDWANLTTDSSKAAPPAQNGNSAKEKRTKPLLPPPRSVTTPAKNKNPFPPSPVRSQKLQASPNDTAARTSNSTSAPKQQSTPLSTGASPASSSLSRGGDRSLPGKLNQNKLAPRLPERQNIKPRSNSQTPRSNNDKELPAPSLRSTKQQEDCAACGSVVVTRVRCVHCKETVYCSMFCRGNDRYKHAAVCTAAVVAAAPSSAKKPLKKSWLAEAEGATRPAAAQQKRQQLKFAPKGVNPIGDELLVI